MNNGSRYIQSNFNSQSTGIQLVVRMIAPSRQNKFFFEVIPCKGVCFASRPVKGKLNLLLGGTQIEKAARENPLNRTPYLLSTLGKYFNSLHDYLTISPGGPCSRFPTPVYTFGVLPFRRLQFQVRAQLKLKNLCISLYDLTTSIAGREHIHIHFLGHSPLTRTSSKIGSSGSVKRSSKSPKTDEFMRSFLSSLTGPSALLD